MARPRKRVMSIEPLLYSTAAIPLLEEFQESVKTKPICHYRNFSSSSVPEHRGWNGLSNYTEDYCHSAPISSRLIREEAVQKKRCLECLSYTSRKPTSKLNSFSRKGLETSPTPSSQNSISPKTLIKIYGKVSVFSVFLGAPNSRRLWVPYIFFSFGNLPWRCVLVYHELYWVGRLLRRGVYWMTLE